MLIDNNPSLEQTGTYNWPKEIAPDNVKKITFDINAKLNQCVITGIDDELPLQMAIRESALITSGWIQESSLGDRLF